MLVESCLKIKLGDFVQLNWIEYDRSVPKGSCGEVVLVAYNEKSNYKDMLLVDFLGYGRISVRREHLVFCVKNAKCNYCRLRFKCFTW